MRVHLWGRSSYETVRDISERVEKLRSLGFQPSHCAEPEPELRDVAILVVNSRQKVDSDLLDRAPRLQLVVTITSGYDHIDLASAERRGVAVARCPLARRDAVVETSVAMGLALLRRLPWLQERARADVWARGELPSRALGTVRGLRVGVIGHGVIGSRAAEIWRALGAEVEVADPAIPGTQDSREVIAKSELCTLHCSLSASSRHLVDRSLVARLSPGSILVNTARGDCLDLEAVLEAPHLGGLGLDVFPNEPCPNLSRLARREDVLVTPHSAGYHEGLTRDVTLELRDTLRAWRAEEELKYRIA